MHIRTGPHPLILRFHFLSSSCTCMQNGRFTYILDSCESIFMGFRWYMFIHHSVLYLHIVLHIALDWFYDRCIVWSRLGIRYREINEF